MLYTPATTPLEAAVRLAFRARIIPPRRTVRRFARPIPPADPHAIPRVRPAALPWQPMGSAVLSVDFDGRAVLTYAGVLADLVDLEGVGWRYSFMSGDFARDNMRARRFAARLGLAVRHAASMGAFVNARNRLYP